MFHVGQRVVCVDASPSLIEWASDDDIPVVGNVYTITRIFLLKSGLAFDLVEIHRGAIAAWVWNGMVGYGAYRFRPIISRKTDISFAHEILRTVTTPTKETV